MYAIVDIETTGSHAHSNGITEIAIVLHNGKEIEGRYSSLVKPGYKIPRFVAALTGITDDMVAEAPDFSEIAETVFTLLSNRIFIAHNVNFDYSFVKYHLKEAGFEFNARKLCTVRLSRTAFPGFRKYGLDSLCQELNIMNGERHRATGDAEATAILFDMIICSSGTRLIKEYLKKENREQILPPNLPKEHIHNLPYVPGIYYFHDAKGKVIYVGKAKSIKQRVVSHFIGFDPGSKRQGFLKHIHSVSCKETPTEFIAYLLESIEIKRLWPQYNYSQKKFEWQYGIYMYEDNCGYLRLAMDKKRKYLHPLLSFSNKTEGYRILWKLVKDFGLHAGLCFLDTTCDDAEEPVEEYNEKVNAAIKWIGEQKETYLITEETRGATSCILVEEGKFYGMGLLDNKPVTTLEELKERLTPYPENEVIRSMLAAFVNKYPHKVRKINDSESQDASNTESVDIIELESYEAVTVKMGL